MSNTDYVVTVHFDYRFPDKKTKENEDGFCVAETSEFFRGPKKECLRIARAFGGASNDKQRTKLSTIIVGRAKDWDQFVREGDGDIA